MLFWKRKAKKFRKLTTSEIKDSTRILIIDDNEQDELISYTKSHGWIKPYYLNDLSTFVEPELLDSHIICIDINGVGEKLGKKNGLDLLVSIKERYPYKKVIIYSTQPTTNFFHKANELLDKRILKQGDLEPFLAAFNELAIEIFDWDSVMHQLYEKYTPHFPVELEFLEFKKKFEKVASNSNEIDPNKVALVLKIGVPVVKTGLVIVEQIRKAF